MIHQVLHIRIVPISLGSPSHDLFLTCMMRNGLTQLVSHPTHGSNCIDLVLVSTPDLIWDISIVEPFSSSCDHSAIHFSVSYPVVISDRQNHCFLDFFNADYCSMISIMKDIDWSFLYLNSLSVEMFWSKISNVLHSCIAQFVPRRYQSRKPFSYPLHIRRLLGLKKLWYRKDKVRYKHFARKYDMAVKDFILSQENNVLKKKSLSSFYSYVNSKLTTSQCIPPLIDSNDNLAVSNHDKCTVLNDYFASVFTVDDGLLPEFVPRLSENKSLNCVLFPFDKVLKTLKSLPSKCSKTPDGFPAFFLKSLAPAIAFPLSLLFEMSMSTGHIPLVWKTAFVCPVFKKGSRKQPSNYRPISQTCILCKVMESIISSSMISFLRTHNLISQDQFGFLSRRSACTQLLITLNNWTLNVDNGMKVDVVYTDIAKAFDTVSHSKLLLKVEAYGFKSNLLQWIRAFLNDRSQPWTWGSWSLWQGMMRAVKKLAPLRCPKLHMTRPQGEYTSTPTRNTWHHWQSASLAQRQPLAADPAVRPASEIKVGLSGDTTVRSKAAGLPQSQLEARIQQGVCSEAHVLVHYRPLPWR